MYKKSAPRRFFYYINLYGCFGIPGGAGGLGGLWPFPGGAQETIIADKNRVINNKRSILLIFFIPVFFACKNKIVPFNYTGSAVDAFCGGSA